MMIYRERSRHQPSSRRGRSTNVDEMKHQLGTIRAARVDLETSVCERPHVLAEMQDVLARIVIRGAVEPV